MGIGGISIWQLLIILAIIVLIFGTKKLKSMGSDLGGAVKGFKKAVSDDEAKQLGDSEKNSVETKAEAEQAEATSDKK
ncbi:Sec-independent protein translocase subunit TatA [Porticoccaceae bacterium LTM1]|nr:Sec-independent protein translocase subunit TatA [Porticoccaceae bacterium LTM1]